MKNDKAPFKLVYAAPAFGPKPGNAGAEGPDDEASAPGPAYPANYTEPVSPEADTPIEDVYNGPEMYEEFDGGEPEETVEDPGLPYPANCAEPEEPDDITLTEAVYNGPEMFEEPEQPVPAENDVPMAPVYAGPKPSEKRGMKLRDRLKATECVYAGPDYFAGRGSRTPRMERVYAGPPVDPNNKDQNDRRKLMQGVYAVPNVDPSMMMVYAGPQIPQNGLGMFMPPFPAADGRSCRICGSKVSDTAKYCENCGALLDTTQTDPSFCPSCGAKRIGDSPFCHECGTPLAKKAEPAATDAPAEPEIQAGPDKVTCPNCGADLPASSPFCSECGTPIPKKPAPSVSGSEPEKPKDSAGANEPVFQSVYACPPLLKKGGKEPVRKGLFAKLFKKEKK